MREIVLDTETTGFDAKGTDRIVEIGCVELINHIPSGEDFHVYINPERDMPQAAFEVHGLSTEFLSDKPLFADVAQGFIDFIQDSLLVIHNAPFDVGFLNAELERVNMPLLTNDRVLDTLALARRKHPGAQNSLDALCRRYNIDNSARDKHGALLDSEILALVYSELIGGHQAFLNLNGPGQSGSGARAKRPETSPRPNALPSRISEDEAVAHKAFIETMGEKALWNKFS
ncbi:MAG: DNA polymerase III subunit epsilon [Methyloligellaceae bacterium]